MADVAHGPIVTAVKIANNLFGIPRNVINGIIPLVFDELNSMNSV